MKNKDITENGVAVEPPSFVYDPASDESVRGPVPAQLLYDLVDWSIYYGVSEGAVKKLESIVSKYF